MVRRLGESVRAPSSAVTGGAAPSGDGAARFEDALAQAAGSPKRSEWAELETGSVSLDGIILHSEAFVAADDAWVEVVAIAEELRNPALSPATRQMLFKRIAKDWQIFQSQSEPIARMLEQIAVHDGAEGQGAASPQDWTKAGGEF